MREAQAHGLLAVGGVGEADDERVAAPADDRVERDDLDRRRAARHAPCRQVDAGRLRPAHLRIVTRHDALRTALREHLLAPVGRRAAAAEAVDQDQRVAVPRKPDAADERRVGGHLHEVGVALEAHPERGLRDGVVHRVHVARTRVARRPLADVEVDAAPRVAVVAPRVVKPPTRTRVQMLVGDIGRLAPDPRPRRAVALRLEVGERVDAHDELELRPGAAHLRGDEIVAVVVVRAEVLVSDAHVRQRERARMPHPRAERAPFRRLRVAERELNAVEDVRREEAPARTRHGRVGLAELAVEGRREDRERTRPEVFAVEEILVEPEPKRLVVAPAVPERHTLLDRPDRQLPVVPRGEGRAFHHAAAGEAERRRTQSRHQLADVRAQAVRAPAERPLRTQRDLLEVEGPRRVGEDGESRAPLRPRRTQHGLEPLPVDGRRDRRGGGEGRPVGGLKAHGEADVAARPEGKDERLAGRHAHLVHRAVVADARQRPERLDAEVAGRVGELRVRVADGDARGRAVAEVFRPALDLSAAGQQAGGVRRREVKAAVPDELRVEAAVGREGDVLEEQAVEVFRDGRPFAVLVDAHLHGRHRPGRQRHTHHHCCQICLLHNSHLRVSLSILSYSRRRASIQPPRPPNPKASVATTGPPKSAVRAPGASALGRGR